MDDPISRRAALEIVYRELSGWVTDDERLHLEGVAIGIESLPSAQPERKKGEWIIDRGLYKCSSCNGLWTEWWAVAKPIERMRKEMPYCPMCGADMRGEQNG